jgi:hypothetical protein
MEITVQRFSSNNESTIGILLIDCDFQCFTLEDEYRSKKEKGETRIPAGRYRITLRAEGGFHQRYLQKFGLSFHEGMLWIRDVPNFEYILIHIGNDDDDTAGCLLVGNTSNNNRHGSGFVGDSTGAYRDLYPKVLAALKRGDEVWINYKDEGEIDGMATA